MIPFSPPYVDDDIINEVTDSLRSGWITTGPKVMALEQEVAKYVGIENVLCVNSWTSGMMLMLRWIGVGQGDEVIIPAYTYSATALAVMNIGAIPVMVDVEDDFNISVTKIRAAITEKTKVIAPVDIAGWPCDYEAINALVKEDGIVSKFKATGDFQEKIGRITVVADSAHSIGATYKGVRIGKQTDITIFSFHAVKNITTAEGGAICLNLPEPFDNKELYAKLRVFTLNGQTKDAFTKSKAGGWRYDIIYQGLKVNMPDVCAAIGLVQMKKYDDKLLKQRKRVFNRYNEAFLKQGWAVLPPNENVTATPSFHLYALRIKDITEAQRDLIIDEITKKEVAVNVHFIPMPMLTLFKEKGYDIENYPNAYAQYKGEISLPIYPQLTDEQIDIVIDAVISSYQKIIC